MSRAKSSEDTTQADADTVAGSEVAASDPADGSGAGDPAGAAVDDEKPSEAAVAEAEAASPPAPSPSNSSDAAPAGDPVAAEDPGPVPPPAFSDTEFEAFKERMRADDQYAIALLWRFEQLANLLGWPELGHLAPAPVQPVN